MRQFEDQTVVVVLNSSSNSVELTLNLPWESGVLMDLLSPEETFNLRDSKLTVSTPPAWGRVLSLA